MISLHENLSQKTLLYLQIPTKRVPVSIMCMSAHNVKPFEETCTVLGRRVTIIKEA